MTEYVSSQSELEEALDSISKRDTKHITIVENDDYKIENIESVGSIFFSVSNDDFKNRDSTLDDVNMEVVKCDLCKLYIEGFNSLKFRECMFSGDYSFEGSVKICDTKKMYMLECTFTNKDTAKNSEKALSIMSVEEASVNDCYVEGFDTGFSSVFSAISFNNVRVNDVSNVFDMRDSVLEKAVDCSFENYDNIFSDDSDMSGEKIGDMSGSSEMIHDLILDNI